MSTRVYGNASRLDALLARAAVSEPRRAAVIFPGAAQTYAEVWDRACRFAAAVAALRLKKGDRVAFWSANRPEFVEVLFGVSMLGAITAPLDHWWTWTDANVALSQIRPKILVVGGPQALEVSGRRDALQAAGVECVLCLDEWAGGPSVRSYEYQLASANALQARTPVVPTDPAMILFTSGSTGRPKGAVHTHGSLLAAATTMALELGLKEGERTLHFLPLFSSCLEHLIPLTLMRATHIIMPHFDAAAVWESILAFGVTHFDAVPTTLRRIIEVAPARIPESLRLISYASENMPGRLITELTDRMPAVEFVQFYGMIEQLCLTVLSASDQRRKIGTVGRPMMGAQLHLLHAGDGTSGPEEAGEIVARSPTLFAGYWQDAAATTQVMHGEWMRTGDFGRFDAEGFLILEGRIKEIIKSGGLTVIPAEVESVLMQHPGVNEAAVIGVPDERWGEAVHAFVTLSRSATALESELKSFCHERLTGYKCPKVIHIVQELPRTGIGKIARRVVRAQAAAATSDLNLR
ncbi:MAG: class I adenylate-forming enzyme family protein [Steroidobacteraceae bacterium]